MGARLIRWCVVCVGVSIGVTPPWTLVIELFENCQDDHSMMVLQLHTVVRSERIQSNLGDQLFMPVIQMLG